MHGPALVRPVGADLPQGRPSRRVFGRCARRGRAARACARRRGRSAGARRGRLDPATVVSEPVRAHATTLDELPLRDELRSATPYGAPQLDVAIRLNTNENPYGPSDAVVADMAAAAGRAARSLNRYPDR